MYRLQAFCLFAFLPLRPSFVFPLPAALVLIIIAGLLAPATVRERFTSIFDLQNPTILVRFSQWQIGAKIIADHPFFGVGWHDLAPFTRQYAQPDPRLPAGVEVVTMFWFLVGLGLGQSGTNAFRSKSALP